MEIVSGAGHDAVYMARVAPTAMIFVPCADGISHNEIEDAKPADLAAGCARAAARHPRGGEGLSADASRLLREGEAHLKKRAFAPARAALEQAVALLPALVRRIRSSGGRATGWAMRRAPSRPTTRLFRSTRAMPTPDAGWAMPCSISARTQAAAAFRAASALNPRDSGSLYGLGTALAEADDVAGAAAAFAAWGTLSTPAGVDPHLSSSAIARQIRLDDAFFGALDTAPGPELDGAYAGGDTPLLFAAADAGYTTRFVDLIAGNLAARAPGIALHLHVVNPTPESEAKVARAIELTQGHLDMAVTRETVDLARFAAPGLEPLYAAKTYYRRARFLVRPRLIQHYRRLILARDIDCTHPRSAAVARRACAVRCGCQRQDPLRTSPTGCLPRWSISATTRRASLRRSRRRLLPAFPVRARGDMDDRPAALHAAWLHMRRTGQWRDFREFAPGTMNWMDDTFDAEEAQRRFLFISLYSSVPKI
jgi:hypothetical protein